MTNTPEYRKAYYLANREKLLQQDKARYLKRKDSVIARNKINRKKIRLETLQAYGGHCQCCGETQYEFMSVDHINGGGSAERKKFNGEIQLFRHLRRSGWPPGYQVLCHNCNLAKGFYGACPHQQACD